MPTKDILEGMSIKEYPPQQHIPVLLESVLSNLQPKVGETYLDLTAGYGGHARAVLEETGNFSGSVLVDRDDYAISQLQSFADEGSTLLHTDFLTAARQLKEQGRKFDLIVVDLGVSSPQLDTRERGFSFTKDGPLDMRMDRRQDLTAALFINKASEDTLRDIIMRYGEERSGMARIFAKAIIDSRPFTTTGQLARVIEKAYRGPWKKTHPATRTFQALRIAINDELYQIEELLPILPHLLTSGGRVGVITFHSLEDRLVKSYFKRQQDSGLESQLQILTKKPVAGDTEDVHNPRARSAKLRVAVKK
jgi:16S rRNA (cytosine1402-N4)-methyltransferase